MNLMVLDGAVQHREAGETAEQPPVLALTKYDVACEALAAARNADEVLDIRDQAEAMRAYGRQAKNKQLEVDAAEIRIRAERRLGELIHAQKETVGLNTGTAGAGRPPKGGARPEPPIDSRPTLAEAGIDKKLSSRAQKLAAVPVEEFESDIAEWRGRVEAENKRVTTKLERKGEQQRRHPVHRGARYPQPEKILERAAYGLEGLSAAVRGIEVDKIEAVDPQHLASLKRSVSELRRFCRRLEGRLG